MIAVDTSALVAMLTDEAQTSACRLVFEAEPLILISAGTALEALLVATPRGFHTQMKELMAAPTVSIVPLTGVRAEQVSIAYAQWGKGFHPASLNFGDCFAYATAREFDCPLLYVGADFERTDVKSVISATLP